MEGTFKKALSALAVFAILFTVGGCSLLPTEEDVIAPPLVEPEVVEYKTTQVEKGDIIQYSTLSGTFVSTLQYDVSFEERGGTYPNCLSPRAPRWRKGRFSLSWM